MCIKTLLWALYAATLAAASYQPKLIDRIDVKLPGFVAFIPTPDQKSHHLAITAFNGAPLTADHVYYVSNYTGSRHDQIVELSNQNVIWPNEATFANMSIISPSVDPYGGVLVPSGFLVPGKDKGGIFYYPFQNADRSLVTDLPPSDLTDPFLSKDIWFYHRLTTIKNKQKTSCIRLKFYLCILLYI